MIEFGIFRHRDPKSQATIAQAGGTKKIIVQRLFMRTDVDIKEKLKLKGFRKYIDVINLSAN